MAFSASRIVLDLGLARATRDFNEWTFPGIGGVGFARQFAWSVMALRLAPQCKRRAQRPMVIAEALEALAAWIIIHRLHDADNPRIRGKRKLANTRDDCSFPFLSNRSNYVSQPMRMGTTAGLVGCGLAKGPATRFDRLELTSEGNMLADTLLNAPLDRKSAHRTVKSWLLENWIEADSSPGKIPNAVSDALFPGPRGDQDPIPSVAEVAQLKPLILRNDRRRIMRDALTHYITRYGREPHLFNSDDCPSDAPERFVRMIGDEAQRKRVEAGIAYVRTTSAALDVLSALAVAAREGTNRMVATAALPSSVVKAAKVLSECCGVLEQRIAQASLPQGDAMQFCAQQHASQPLEKRMAALVARTKDVFSMVGVNIVFTRADRSDLFSNGSDAALAIADGDAPGESLGRTPVPGRLFRAYRLLDDLSLLDHDTP